MKWFGFFNNRTSVVFSGSKSCMTVSFELFVENGIATLNDRTLKLYVKGSEDVTALLKPCHWTEIATKSLYHKTGMSAKPCKLQLKQTFTNPTHLFDVATESREHGAL